MTTIRQAVRRVLRVGEVEGDADDGVITVVGEDPLPVEEIKTAITSAGFDVERTL